MKSKMSMMVGDSESIGIRKAGEERGMSGDNMDLIDQTGDGDNRVRLWMLPCGQRVIETNGDPHFEVDGLQFVQDCESLGLELNPTEE